jgi:hypothetical protein
MAKTPRPLSVANLAIAAITSMDRASLLVLWGDLRPSPAPSRISQPYLRRILAFELQARRS